MRRSRPPWSSSLNGQPPDLNATDRVVLNSFLGDGGDNFTAFAQGTDRLGGDLDLDAFQNFLKASPTIPDTTERVKRLNRAVRETQGVAGVGPWRV